MDKNGARGRACKIVSLVLNGSIKDGVVDVALNKQLPPKDAALVRQEMQAIADECEAMAELLKAVEHGEPVADKYKAAKAAHTSARLFIGNEEDETEGQYSVSLYALGEVYGFDLETPDAALKLYNALLNVTDVTAG